jgi:GNAT superfamily N-acetyltransferase
MLDYAENYLYGIDDRGRKFINLFIYDTDVELISIVKPRGYIAREPTPGDFLSQYSIREEFPEIHLPDGFQLKDLGQDNNLIKVQRVLWRGFNHPGEPPEDRYSVWVMLETAPNFRRDLNLIVEAPNIDFVSYCGMWYVAAKRYCYVEPVATDPNYRLKGLARAVVLEGIRRCGLLGAKVAYVTTGIPVYEHIGFKRIRSNHWWRKRF